MPARVDAQYGAPDEVAVGEVETSIEDVHPDAGTVSGIAIGAAEGQESLIDPVQPYRSTGLNDGIGNRRTTWFCSTNSTAGSWRSAAAAVSDSSIVIPLNAAS